ncbi:MAG: hypothetical protein AABY86_07715 [Bdellovibrionota bacterium]
MKAYFLLLLFCSWTVSFSMIQSAKADPPACQSFETVSGSTCTHRCSNTYHIWSGEGESASCQLCPSGQIRGVTGNSCIALVTCPTAERRTPIPDYDIIIPPSDSGPEIGVEICTTTTGVAYKIGPYGQLYNLFNNPITAIPEACSHVYLQRNNANVCVHRCTAESTSGAESWNVTTHSCTRCENNKVVGNDNNDCVCAPDKTWHTSMARCLRPEIITAMDSASTACVTGSTRNEALCRTSCTALKEYYERSSFMLLNADKCGNYFIEASHASGAVPSGFTWQGVPTILKTGTLSSGFANCGSNFEICFGPAVKTVTLPETSTPEQIVAMVKCYIPKNTTQCPEDLATNRNCQMSRLQPPNNPGIQNCSNDVSGRCLCDGTTSTNNYACRVRRATTYINSHCSGTQAYNSRCGRECRSVNSAPPNCTNIGTP